MNPYLHAQISVKKRGGKIEDYYEIHSFIDSTKELCCDNRHRILHNMWAVRRIVIPIFGAVITNSDGKKIDVKDICEQDHLISDFDNKFIPNLDDFVRNFHEMTKEEKILINKFHEENELSKEESDLLLSPLSITGELKSLRLTHNCWFFNDIMPRVFNRSKIIDDIPLKVSSLFNNMKFTLWMDNGASYPPSCKNMETIL